MKTIIQLTLAVALICLLGCTRVQEKELVGTWKSIDAIGGAIYVTQFSKDGTVTMEGRRNEENAPLVRIAEGKWKIVDKGKIRIVYSNENGTQTVLSEYTINGDIMTSVDTEGKASLPMEKIH